LLIPRSRRIDKTWKPKVAGYLNIASFAILFTVAFILFLDSFIEGKPENAWALVFNIPGFLALLGGIDALEKEKWGFALIGSICAILCGLGILSVILISMSKKEFNTRKLR
jgi:hypothetical protein